MSELLSVEVCIPAYNEEKNIQKILDAYVNQQLHSIAIHKICVVSSGSTDGTDAIVRDYSQRFPSIVLITEPVRNGKASAINLFLEQSTASIIVLQSADTIPDLGTIEKLCIPFISDEKVGMTGGAPIPVNSKDTFVGYVVHTWWWFHRNIPRFGELVAFRNLLPAIPVTSSVDEAYIQARFIQMGYKVVIVSDAVVRNKGAESVRDIIVQRRRILNGHIRLYEDENIRIHNMTKSGLRLLLFSYPIASLKELFWLFGGLFLEIWVNLLGRYDKYVKRYNPYIWKIAHSTKHLAGTDTSQKCPQQEIIIGIPAYNSEENIRNLLQQVFALEQHSVLIKKVIVYSDASSDATVQRARAIIDTRLEVIDGHERQGFAGGVKYFVAHSEGCHLVLLNDDIQIRDPLFLEKLCTPLYSQVPIGLMCGSPQPMKPRTFIEGALVSRLAASDDLAHRLHGGANLFACDGKVMVLTRDFISQLRLPEDNDLMGNVDAYLYFLCLELGFHYFSVLDAIVYYRNPATLRDYISWIERNNKNKELLKQRFTSSVVEREYYKPPGLLLRTVLRQFIRNPLGSIVILILEPVIYLVGLKNKKFTAQWDLVVSSKNP